MDYLSKQAIVLDPALLLRFGLGGLITGASTSALVNLLHTISSEKAKRKKEHELMNDNENTLVFELPAERLAKRGGDEILKKNTDGKDSGDKVPSVHSEGKAAGLRHIARDDEGKYGPVKPLFQRKHAASEHNHHVGPMALTASMLAGIGGTAAGFQLMNKLYKSWREKNLQGELDSVRHEYLQGLISPDKQATIIDHWFPQDLEKTADHNGNPFNFIDSTVASAMLLTILGAGGAAYVTKRMLDTQAAKKQDEEFVAPKVKRIVFRTAKGPIDSASLPLDAGEQQTLKAAFCVFYGKLSGEDTLVKDAGVKQAIVTELYKFADDKDLDNLFARLEADPELTKNVIQAFSSKIPLLGGAVHATAGVPGLRGLYMSMMKHKAKDMLSNPSVHTNVADVTKQKGVTADNPFAAKKLRFMGYGGDADMMSKIEAMKSAQLNPLVGLGIQSAVGGTAGAALSGGLSAASEKREEVKRRRRKQEKQSITVSAADPQAAKYLNDHQQQILKAIVRAATITPEPVDMTEG